MIERLGASSIAEGIRIQPDFTAKIGLVPYHSAALLQPRSPDHRGYVNAEPLLLATKLDTSAIPGATSNTAANGGDTVSSGTVTMAPWSPLFVKPSQPLLLFEPSASCERFHDRSYGATSHESAGLIHMETMPSLKSQSLYSSKMDERLSSTCRRSNR
ncbi:unnamed protein product [Protopolystoma xenopodis]|uniref:Uncharacterized protein n=1 Tax=Protopolystoma xenopodis TaxID=117903 RepID=A0A3S5FC29_9PLAT|nr:unnamed protein product [Protopolystoma xenopodis]